MISMDLLDFKISVIIPVYNTEKYISRCLESIINNTYKNLEIICVNDGSTDGSATILNNYAKRDKRIIVINKENGGVSSARNVGLKKSTGDIIAFVDSDDWIYYRYFEILLSAMQEKSADIIICNYKLICSDINFKENNIDLIKYNTRKVEFSEAISSNSIKNSIWGRLYSKRCIKSFFDEELFIAEDTTFNINIFSQIKNIKIYLVSYQMYYYFMRDDSITHTLIFINYEPNIKRLLYNLRAEIVDNDMKSIVLIETIKTILSFRYLTMFCLDNKNIKKRCKIYFKECLQEMNKLNSISLITKIQYEILIMFPQIYRLFRIKNDRTLLDFEKKEKRKRKDNQYVT